MASLAERFNAKVDRRGQHHIWTGSKAKDGTGQVRISGRLTTAQRVAWELARGPVPEGVKVHRCPENAACVRLEHLRVDGGKAAAKRPRARRGAGSKREVRPGVWKLTVSAGRFEDG